MTVCRFILGQQLLATVIMCGTALAPWIVWAQSPGSPSIPPAPAPVADAEEKGGVAIVEGPAVMPAKTLSVEPVVEAYCSPRPVRQNCRHDENRRCRLCDPNAALNAMSRVSRPGSSLHALMAMQIANGDAAQMVLYEYDFYPREARLNCHGMMRVLQIARQLPHVPFPLLIQPTLTDPALDEARQAIVADTLLSLEPSIPVERIVVGLPPARGFDGADAAIVHGRVLRLSAGGAPGSGVPAAPAPAAAVPPAR